MKKLLLLLPVAFVLGAFTNQWLMVDITASDAHAAVKLAGLDMTDAEVDSLLPNLNEFKEDFAELRAMTIDNSISPTLVFDPIPSRGLPTKEEPFFNQQVGVIPSPPSLPQNREALAFYSVRDLGALIKSKQISSLELTKLFLERLKKYDEQLHCVISITEERALAEARKADAEIAAGQYRGPLHGIPYGAKDLLAAKGAPTTWGAVPYKEQVLDYDATVIQKLEEAGAVLVAKLTLGALAWGDVWFGGMTRNPWDIESGSSGSSAGSASATVAGLVPFAIGTETLGSIVSPSTVCGATGLRPTFGRVSRHGAMALSWSMDKIGPICRNADDAALVLAAINGRDPLDPATRATDFYYQYGQHQASKPVIGYVKADFERNYPFKQQDSMTLETLKSLGYELVPIELPDYPSIGFILDVEAAAAFDELTRSNRDDELTRQIRNAWPNVFRAARFIPAVEYVQANRARRQLIDDMADLMEKVEVYVHPSWASQSLRITNFTGHPCITVPNGYQANGRPTSITFTGRLYDEATLVHIANAYQEVTDFDDKQPPLFQIK